jgi:hypothetical protein
MAKIYFVVVRSNDIGAAVLDLDGLPPGVTSTIVKHPWLQGRDIAQYLHADLDRTYQCLQELAICSLSAASESFFSEVASLWENLPPQTDGQMKDGIFASIGEETHFIRTSPEVALETFQKLRAIRQR